MSRKARELTATGIYHVMLRGINKQNIFFSEDDFMRMMQILHEAQFDIDPITEKVKSSNLCTIYAYCILDNHVHILIREGEMKIAEIMQSIELRYALYYNKRYERIGHLFQGRFESEPVNDSLYFYTLLRYIHRNPVKALEAKTPEEYPYCSWNEYVTNPSNLMLVLKPEAIKTVLNRYALSDLIQWVNYDSSEATLIDESGNQVTIQTDKCLDMDRFPNPLSDREAFEILSDLTGLTNPEDFRLLDAPTQIYHLLQAIDRGITLRQASRLGTLSYYQIRKANNKKRQSQNQGDSSTAGSGPSVDETKEIQNDRLAELKRLLHHLDKVFGIKEDNRTSVSLQERQCDSLQQIQESIRHIEGLSKKSYHRLHLIVEYLQEHPESKCQDIANHIQAGVERTRILLVQLANVNIVQMKGNARARTYSLLT